MFLHYRTQGFILDKINRGETDRIFTIYTKDFGKLNLLAKAERKIKSKLRAGLEDFYLSEIEFIQGKTQKTLTDTILIKNFKNLRGDLEKLRVAYQISDLVNNLIKGEETDPKIWQLLDETFDIEVFNLYDILGKSEKKIKRLKGRIIGRNGEMRKAIEKFAESYVSVYGKTVSIISDYDNLQIARKAVNMLLSGMPHHSVLKFLENKYNEKKKEEFRKMYKPQF